MCGINGIYQFSGLKSIEKEVISKMNQTMIHRGPDADGIYHDDFVLLGHRRLSIIDVTKKSDQPFCCNDNRYVIIFNGEIYNFQALKSQLPDYDFKTESDTEVVLAAYIKWGKQCVTHFDGMFAFSIWDKVEKSMYIARDKMGIKPLYYVLDNEKIIFSSSVKSILNSGLIKRKLRKESVVDYFRFQTVHAPYTIVEDVYSLMPAQYLYFTEEKQELETYWSPSKTFIYPDNNIEVVQGKVSDLLSTSVEKRMMSDVPFGAFLSGGIDSSIIVGLMAKKHDQKIDTFSVVFKENEFSEGQYANQIAEQYATNHHEIELSVEEFKDMIPTAMKFYDHPSGDGLNSYVVSKKTAEAGVKMALSGLGGDELFAGYPVFNQIPHLQAKKWLASFPNYARKYPGIFNHMIKGTVESSKIKEILKQEYFDSEYLYQFSRQTLMDDQVSNLINIPKLPLNRVFEITHDLIGYNTDGWALPKLSRLSVAEFSTYMQNTLLRDVDQMSMANSLEVRVPFLDHHLIEYTLGIKDKFKTPTSPKKLLVDSFKDIIPEAIYNRPKMGFVLPYEKWMKGELKSFCKENLNEIKNVPYINTNGIDKLWKAFEKGDKRVGWSRVWHLVVLGHWIKENNIEG
jgi:asparagine synthase (glutamine-hydrolysing)